MYIFCLPILLATHTFAQSTCNLDSTCDADKACISQRCVDPCAGACGTNTQCSVLFHTPLCSCLPGFVGDPFGQCNPTAVTTTTTKAPNPCLNSKCGPNSVCNEINDAAVCACETGYIGSPPFCRSECLQSADCSPQKACVNEKCVDPCIDTCGVDATCLVVTRTPICSCPPGLTGDPFTICEQITEPVTPPPNRCVPSPCGANTECKLVRGSPVCECLPFYIGNPLTGCTNRPGPAPPSPATTTTTTELPQPPDPSQCTLPPYPEHGHYKTHIPNAKPGHSYPLVAVNVTCDAGFGIVGSQSTYCFNGYWAQEFPQCVPMCRLDTHPSVEYLCQVPETMDGYRPCTSREPSGTIVNPVCRRPNYYATVTLNFMRCIGGHWNYIATCSPECGKVTPVGTGLVAGGQNAKRGELPWHAGIYKKTFNPYLQVCGGSLISNKIIISAAHCFWDDLVKQLPAKDYAVAVGKIHRSWNDKMDDAQKSDVSEIWMPPRFRGAAANYQDDLAVIVVATSFDYTTYIRPVCLGFVDDFDDIDKLTPLAGTKGKVAGWGLTAANGNASKTLQVIDLPFVEISTCIAGLPFSFQEYITSDKICAGTMETNTGLCKGDSGGGLAFPITDRGALRYYLHGVVSTAPNEENVACNTGTYTTFTQILRHELFIKQFLNEV